MNDLTKIKNNEAVTTSLLVAEVFEKRHDNVLQSINRLLAFKESKDMFVRGTYKNAQGHIQPMFYMNRDGFVLLVMGFNGKKAMEWKFRFIEAFNQMEEQIRFRKSDIQIQKNSMAFLNDNLSMPVRRDFIKANVIADKAVSNIYGFPKMIKKESMNMEMLKDREPVLADVVTLMAMKERFNLDIRVSETIYQKYGEKHA